MGCSNSSLTKGSIVQKAKTNKMSFNKIESIPIRGPNPAHKNKKFNNDGSDLTRKAKDTRKRGTWQLKNDFNFQIDASDSEFEIKPKRCPESELSCLSSGSFSKKVEHFNFLEEPSDGWRAHEN